MKKNKLILCALFLLAGPALSADGDLMEERQEEARENVEELERSDEAIEREETRREENLHPYEKIDPKSRKNMFEEMKSEDVISPAPFL